MIVIPQFMFIYGGCLVLIGFFDRWLGNLWRAFVIGGIFIMWVSALVLLHT